MGGGKQVWVRIAVGKERQPPASHNEFAQISSDNISVEMRLEIINRKGLE